MSGIFFVLALVMAFIPIAIIVFVFYAVRQLGLLKRRIAALEAGLSTMAPTLGVRVPAPTAAAPAAPAPPISPAVMSPTVPKPAFPPAPIPAPVQLPTPAPAPLPAASPRPSQSPSRLEQLIGGIWLQNVGSVLLLLGSFFLILWGYTQGILGPQVLVLAGVALGIVLAWRGDRIARSIRPLGHALLGVGLGVVYITLYLGRFQMHALPSVVTFVLLALLSFVTIDIGLRRSQSIIAALGVFGAFLPLLLSSVDGLGFRLPNATMIAYLVVANGVVVVLTAIRGWSGLVIGALILTSVAWLNNGAGVIWPVSAQVGLSAIFTALGMAPVVRLVKSPDPIRRVDLAVVALAPMLLLVTSLPYFAVSPSATAGALLLALGVLNLAAALWVDAKRTDRDLWRPLTAAATIFITAALERLLAKEDLALAWCVEGGVLVWLGLGARGGWFRLLGYVVSILAALRILLTTGSYEPGTGTAVFGIVNGAALRDLLCLAVMVATADRIGRGRDHLSRNERHMPGVWIVIANALGMIWLAREAAYFARLVAPFPVGTAAPPPRPYYGNVVSTPMTAVAWGLQALALVALARLRKSPIQRHVAYGVGIFAFLVYLVAIADSTAWKRFDWVAGYPTALIMLGAIGVFLLVARLLSIQRVSAESAFRSGERLAPQSATVIANTAILLWTARVAWEWAYAGTPGMRVGVSAYDSRAILAAVITSAGWILQAAMLFSMGWLRRSAFYRWLGLSLVALTLLKFVLFDLQRVDVFWRFVGALVIGAALLLLSFIYQRGKRENSPASGV